MKLRRVNLVRLMCVQTVTYFFVYITVDIIKHFEPACFARQIAKCIFDKNPQIITVGLLVAVFGSIISCPFAAVINFIFRLTSKPYPFLQLGLIALFGGLAQLLMLAKLTLDEPVNDGSAILVRIGSIVAVGQIIPIIIEISFLIIFVHQHRERESRLTIGSDNNV